MAPDHPDQCTAVHGPRTITAVRHPPPLCITDPEADLIGDVMVEIVEQAVRS